MAHPGNDSRQQFTARDLLRHSPNEVRAGTENAALDRLWQQRIETVQGVALAPAELVGMRIWSQVLTWFYVNHTAKSHVPQMSAKQQECDSAGNAHGRERSLGNQQPPSARRRRIAEVAGSNPLSSTKISQLNQYLFSSRSAGRPPNTCE
jgi:hypothetical protein